MSHIDEGELTAYGDGAFTPGDADAQRIEAHLATCANCRNRLAQSQSLTARASDILAHAVPANVEVPAFETLQVTPKRNAWLPLTWAASLVLMLGTGWFMGRYFGMQTAEAPQVAATRPVEPPTLTPAPAAASEAAPAPSPLSKPVRVDSQVMVAAAPASARERAAKQMEVEAQQTEATRNENVAAAKTLAARSADADRVAAAPPPPPPPVAGVSALSLAEKVVAADSAHIIPDLPVVSSKLNDGVRTTEQKLADGTIITIVTERQVAATGEARKLVESGVTVVRNGVILRVKGPLSVDSLRALAQKIK